MEPLTNWQRWQSYTSGLSSPQNYIDWSWWYIVAASLQRRVWLGPPHQPCYPNMYIILVGDPGIGKGLCIREVTDFLKFWKKKDMIDNPHTAFKSVEDKQLAEGVAQTDLEHQRKIEFQGSAKGAEMIEPLLINVCADAITYEALVEAVGDSYTRINYYDDNNKCKIYGHSSLCFSLQELASLLRKRTNDTVNFLLGLYDCPLDYEYTTLTRGKDRVRRGCLNIIAGTTPSFMSGTFDEKLIDEGFASRTFYICAKRNRKNQMWIPPLTEEQKEHKKHLLNHVRNLTMLYGNVTIDQETTDFMQDWWDKSESNKHTRVNKSLKMIPYYSRKNIHVMKVAMAMHFSESVLMHIPLECFKRAIEFLEREEKNMHLALTLEGNNPVSKATRKILELLMTGEKNFVELMVETHSIIDRKGLEEALSFLVDTNQVVTTTIEDKDMETTTQYWRLRK